MIYYTATSLDGFIADPSGSLEWLFAVPTSPSQADDHAMFLGGIGALVKGSTTYEWVLAEANLLAQPERWREFYGDRPTFVFTTRELAKPSDADITFVHGPVEGVLEQIREAARERDIWVVGGGDLAGQFLDAGALDEIVVSIAPVTLGSGAPLLPRRLESARLRLQDARAEAQFIRATYRVAGGEG